jgi:tetratricopeptide (TPR) repeat protein
MGRLDEALREIERARTLDPLSPVINTQVGWILTFARRYDAAIAQLNRTLEISPQFALAYADLGLVFDSQGKHAEALKAFQKAAEIDDTPDRTVWMTRQYAMLGQTSKAREMLKPLLPLARENRVSPGTVGLVYTALGDHDEAFKWLQIGCSLHSLVPLNVFPLADPLRSDPRFAGIIRCMRLEP